MDQPRKENRESAQKKFRDACIEGAKLSELEMREFSNYCHNQNILVDYMPYKQIKSLAEQWQATSGYNPYHPNRYR